MEKEGIDRFSDISHTLQFNPGAYTLPLVGFNLTDRLSLTQSKQNFDITYWRLATTLHLSGNGSYNGLLPRNAQQLSVHPLSRRRHAGGGIRARHHRQAGATARNRRLELGHHPRIRQAQVLAHTHAYPAQLGVGKGHPELAARLFEQITTSPNTTW
jgi:hypothetical protein